MNMEDVFTDKSKITFLCRVQKSLLSLNSNSSNKKINRFFDIFPADFLENKENLIIICEFFAMIPRRSHNTIALTVKLFQRILPIMKKYLQDESSAIWNIFRFMMYFKLWMFEEGLISIDYILLSAMSAENSFIAEYFLPEIIEHNPEIFHKEIKRKFKETFNDESKYSNESIQKLKENRKKYFQWILNSYDYSDPSYRQIETNSLRLSIKMDDIESFQKIISNSNFSLNMSIKESLIEAFVFQNNEISLINYAIHYNSINIIKFLILNNVDFVNVCSYAVSNGNYDIIHLVESKATDEFETNALSDSIYYCHPKISHYLINKYDKFNQIFTKKKQTFSEEEITYINDILNSTFENCNFMFFKSKILKFLKHHPKFVHDNIYNIICMSFKDMSCFFCKELFKYKGIDINYVPETKNESYLIIAVYEKNSNAVDYLLNNFPDIDVNTLDVNWCSPLYYASGTFSDMKIIKSLCNHPKVNINYFVQKFKMPVYKLALLKGNVIVLEFLINNYKHMLEVGEITRSVFTCLQKHHLLSVKLFLQLAFENKSVCEINQILSKLFDYIIPKQNSEDIIKDLILILDELFN